MKESTRRALVDQAEIAARLEHYRFDEHIRELGLGFHMERDDEDDSWTIEFDLPDDKERDATLYTFRLFDQQNEAFSFHGLKKISGDPGLSGEYRQGILHLRDAYFAYLQDTPEGVEAGFFEDGLNPTRGEIMRVVMNGALGHRRDHSKRERYLTWTRDDIRKAVLHQEFSKIVYVVLGMIKQLLVLTRDELGIDAA